MTGGDFVRNASVWPTCSSRSRLSRIRRRKRANLAQVANEAMKLVNRGIVAYSGIG